MMACERGRGTFLQLKVQVRGTFPVKVVYGRVKGWTSERSLSEQKLPRINPPRLLNLK